MKIAISLLIILQLGCVTGPERGDYKHDASFLAAYCMYVNRKNKDKAFCTAALTEARCFNKYIFCLEPKNRVEEKSFDDCWRILNQK